MHHTPSLIATIVAGIGLAFILGTIANRLRISPLVGYLLAGVVVGPFTPGFIADQVLAPQLAASLGVTLAKVAGFVVLMLIVGRRAIPMLLHYIAHTGSRELFRLAVLSVALGVAFVAAELFDVSFALGAFFAGMTLSESELSQAAAEESLPLRDAFAMLFFVSVGMLFDPTVLVHEPLAIGGVLLLVVIGNPGLAFLFARLFGARSDAALLLAAGLAQIGEFSFILADLGIALGALPDRARHLILAGSILSILLNPLVFAVPNWLLPRLRRRRAPAIASVESPAEAPLVRTRLKDHAILIGYGRVGRLVGQGLAEKGWPLLVIEDAEDAFERAKAAPVEAIHGNAADDRILTAANLGEARMVLVAIPNAFEAGQIVQQARAANPRIEIVARAHFDAEVDHLLRHGADIVIMGEREIARSMLERAARVQTASRSQ